MSSSWQKGITDDVVNIINQSLSENFPKLKSLKDLSQDDYVNLLTENLKDLKDKLVAISFYTTDNKYLYTYDFKNSESIARPVKTNPGILQLVAFKLSNLKITVSAK